jgi:hypothetical protein
VKTYKKQVKGPPCKLDRTALYKLVAIMKEAVPKGELNIFYHLNEVDIYDNDLDEFLSHNELPDRLNTLHIVVRRYDPYKRVDISFRHNSIYLEVEGLEEVWVYDILERVLGFLKRNPPEYKLLIRLFHHPLGWLVFILPTMLILSSILPPLNRSADITSALVNRVIIYGVIGLLYGVFIGLLTNRMQILSYSDVIVRETNSQLGTFLKLLSKEWILYVFLGLDAIAAILQYLAPTLVVPDIGYFIVAAIGLMWASYNVSTKYAKQIIAQPVTEQDRIQLPSDHNTKVQKELELVLELKDGNEFEYQLQQNDDVVGARHNPYPSFLSLHLSITNTGSQTIDILVVKATYRHTEIPWYFSTSDPLDRDNKEITFPFKLTPNESRIVTLRSSVTPQVIYNSAQFAARLGDMQESLSVKAQINVEATNSRGPIGAFELTYDVPLRRLRELYVHLWQQQDRSELLRLARAFYHSSEQISLQDHTLESKEEPIVEVPKSVDSVIQPKTPSTK